MAKIQKSDNWSVRYPPNAQEWRDSESVPEHLQPKRFASAVEQASHCLQRMPGPFGLGAAHAQQIAERMQYTQVAAGHTLLLEYARVTDRYMLLILDGSLTYHASHSGGETTLAVDDASSPLRFFSFLLPDLSPYSCTVASDARLALLSHSAVNDLVTQAPETAARLFAVCSTGVHDRLVAVTARMRTLVAACETMEAELAAQARALP
jgi:hypothetical protein